MNEFIFEYYTLERYYNDDKMTNMFYDSSEKIN